MSLLCSSTNWSSISFLSSFLSFFSQGWSAPGWSLWTQGGLWGWAGALNPTPSPPLTPCTLLQLPFFLCPGQEMDRIHSKEKKINLEKHSELLLHPCDGMEPRWLPRWLENCSWHGWHHHHRGASAQRIPKPIKSLKIVHRRFVFYFFVFFFFCFAFKGSL